MVLRPCVAGLVALLGSCAAPAEPPLPADLGNRLRVHIAGRGREASITSADYFLFLVVRGPGGARKALRVLAPATIDSEGLSLILGKKIEALFDLPDGELVESLHGDPRCAHDAVLAQGHSLCQLPGSYYAYRIVDRGPTMVADLEPEIRLGMITTDGSRYVELRPAAGPELARGSPPPGWPPGTTW